jgi:hypothetical protein
MKSFMKIAKNNKRKQHDDDEWYDTVMDPPYARDKDERKLVNRNMAKSVILGGLSGAALGGALGGNPGAAFAGGLLGVGAGAIGGNIDSGFRLKRRRKELGLPASSKEEDDFKMRQYYTVER